MQDKFWDVMELRIRLGDRIKKLQEEITSDKNFDKTTNVLTAVGLAGMALTVTPLVYIWVCRICDTQ